MATDGKVKTLYEDREQTQAVFPRTKTNAVSDGEGYSLDNIINALQVAIDGKAPDGYGLGKSAIWTENLDTATKCGFYNWTEGAQGAPLRYGSVLVINREAPQGSRIIQLGFEPCMETIGAILIRYRTNSNWTEWEWVNPPMSPGVEYRTTERHNGKAVYVTRLIVGELLNNGVTQATLPSTPTEIVELYGTVKSSSYTEELSFPLITTSGAIGARLYKATTRSITVKTFADYSGYIATATVKYTKD